VAQTGLNRHAATVALASSLDHLANGADISPPLDWQRSRTVP
jgi:hypothetical protein